MPVSKYFLLMNVIFQPGFKIPRSFGPAYNLTNFVSLGPAYTLTYFMSFGPVYTLTNFVSFGPVTL